MPQSEHTHGPDCQHFCDSLSDEERTECGWATDEDTRDAAHILLMKMAANGAEASMAALEANGALFHAIMDMVATGTMILHEGKTGVSDILLVMAVQVYTLVAQIIEKERQQKGHDTVAKGLLDSLGDT